MKRSIREHKLHKSVLSLIGEPSFPYNMTVRELWNEDKLYRYRVNLWDTERSLVKDSYFIQAELNMMDDMVIVKSEPDLERIYES